MKPQLLITEMPTGGYHNGDLGRTRSRLDKAKAWKRQRIITLIPADIPRTEERDGKTYVYSGISANVYLSHCNLAFPPNNNVVRMLARGFEVGEAYSTAIEQILAHPELSQWEYLLTVEHDNTPPADGVLRLLERMEANPRFSCIGGLYFTKGYGGVAQIWGSVDDPCMNFRPQLPDPNGGLVECNGTGMGFNLWRLSMFKDKKLRRPWFVTQKHDGVATQDLYFASDARKHGYRFAVDCSVRVGHYDPIGDVTW